jgi:hypothetical protein
VVSALTLACSAAPAPAQSPKPQPTAPLPATNLAGQRVMLLPLTAVIADDSLGWQAQLGDRRAALARADSIVEALIGTRAPEPTWVWPRDLRRAAQLSAGMVGDPHQFPTVMLRPPTLTDVPDPLRGQLRNLAAVGGGRYALVPAALVYWRTAALPDDTPPPAGAGVATAELTLALVDTRLGKVAWRTVARGAGDDPWTALAQAVKAATPGLP